MHISRRSALTAAPSLLLFGCGTQTSQVQTYADLITAGVVAFAPVARAKASPADQARIDAAVASVQAADKALATATGQQATLNVQSIVAAVQGIAPIAIALLPAGSTEAMAASAALSLLPAILRAAGVVSARAGVPTLLSEDAAVVFLRGLKR